MSVVGFDIGCDFSKIAVAYQKKIQIVPNELTKLITPTLTAFSAKERQFGDGALTQFTRNYKCTISQIKRFLGRRADDATIQEEAAFWLPGVETGALEDGRFGIHVETSQGRMCLAPEQILSGFLGQLKKFTATFLNGPKVTDCVIACPSYFDDAQRRALLTAAKLSELKVLRLLEETTAIALNYGILRPLPEEETQRVVFVDLGYASTQVAIVDFIRGKLSVRYKSSNPFVGGRNFDRAIYEYFRKQWMEKHKENVDDFPKQKFKLLQSAKKIKKLLTGNKDAVWTLDCFHNDRDFSLSMTREQMEQACDEEKVFEGMLEPLNEALQATNDDNIKVHSCEIVGGPSRVPVAQRRILECIRQHESAKHIEALSTTLNGDECVARGSALMCAMLSPNFRVRDFQVQDTLTWPITISYPSDKSEQKENVEQLIMRRGDPQPCTAKVMFNKSQNFVFQLQHPEEYKTKDGTVSIQYPFGTQSSIGEFSVQLVPLTENAVQAPKIKLLLDINKQGLLDWPKASLIEYVKREPTPEPVVEPKKDSKDKPVEDKGDADKKADGDAKDPKEEMSQDTSTTDDAPPDSPMPDAADQNQDESKPDQPEDDSKMDVDEDKPAENTTESDPKSDAKSGDKTKEAPKKKKDKRKVTRSLLITGNFHNQLKAEAYNKMFELEAQFINVDRIVFETDEAKNDLETYVYALRDRIEDTHRPYIAEADREALSSQLTAMEDWVYEEGDEANKTQFLERLKQLKDIGDPMEYRKWEAEHREQRAANLKKLIGKYQQWPMTEEEKYAHIPEEKRKEVLDAAYQCDSWLSGELIKQDKQPLHETPVLKCSDIDHQYRTLYDKCNKIVNIPKPKPKPEPKKEEKKDDKDADKTGDAAADDAAADSTKVDESGDTPMKDESAKDENVQQDVEPTGDDATKVDGMDVE